MTTTATPMRDWSSFQGIALGSSTYNASFPLYVTGKGYFSGDVVIGSEITPQANLHIFKTEGSVGTKDATIMLGGYSTQGATIASYRPESDSNSRGLVLSTRQTGVGMRDVLWLDQNARAGFGTPSPGGNVEIAEAGTNTTTDLFITGYNDQAAYTPGIALRKSHNDSLGTLTETIDTEVLGRIRFFGCDSNDAFVASASIIATQNTASSVGNAPSSLTFEASQFRFSTGRVGLGLTPTANMPGLSIEAGLLTLKETTTPTADADYAKIYSKNDNKLYFQDGAGAEHEVSLAA